MKRWSVLLVLACVASPTLNVGYARDVAAGSYEDPAKDFSEGARNDAYSLKGDVTFGWKTGQLTGNVDLGGYTLTMDTGGGNPLSLTGSVSGKGGVVWICGGATEVWRLTPSSLGGNAPNTFTGFLRVRQGTLALAKPSGVNACAGNIALGGGANAAYLRWDNDHQIPDAASITCDGPHESELNLHGHSETAGLLMLNGDGSIAMGKSAATIRFAACASSAWTAGRQLIIREWDGAREGKGKHQVIFGDSTAGLSAPQIAQVGFINPGGAPAGLYRARILPTGEIVPGNSMVTATNPPFDVSPKTCAQRSLLLQPRGLQRLVSLPDGVRISFFGDSITWQANGAPPQPAPQATTNPRNDFKANYHYYNQIGRALEGAGKSRFQLFNHGINGGGVITALTGAEDTEQSGSKGAKLQAPFADLIAQDKPDAVSLFLGINDIWWRGTTPEKYEQSLRELAAAAKSRGTAVVFVTPALQGEKPDGSNPNDNRIDQFCEIMRKVAGETGASLADLRKACVAYLQNNNWELRLDGSLRMKENGLLTYDGVHLTETGAKLVADTIADALCKALSRPATQPSANPASLASSDKAAASDPNSQALAGTAPTGLTPVTSALPLIPWPRDLKLGVGRFALTPASRIVCANAELRPLAEVLGREIQIAARLALKTLEGTPRAGDIALQWDKSVPQGDYRLEVADMATVTGADYLTVANGTVTLLQALQILDGKASIARMTVNDKPDYSYRAVMVDVARKYHSIESLKQVVEMCRLYKIRYLHLHLSDDHLFMFPSTAFPAVGKGNSEFARFDPPSAKAPIQPYQIVELRDLESFSRDRGVAIIPEIDLPGHSSRLVGDAPETFKGKSTNGSTINIADPKAIEGAATLLNEVMDVFQSTPYLHIGGDEVGLDGIETTEDFRRAREKYGIKSAHDLYRKFIVDMHAVITKRGKRMIVWEEAFSPRSDEPFPLPKDAVVLVWCLNNQPQAILDSGHQVINGGWTPLYIVRGDKRSPEFLYHWRPNQFGPHTAAFQGNWVTINESPNFLGAQLLSWENSESTEIQSLRHRAAVLAEHLWNRRAPKSFADFTRRQQHTDAILDALTQTVRIRMRGKFTTDENTSDEPVTVSLECGDAGLQIRYRLDNMQPDASSPLYSAPYELRESAWIRAAAFTPAGERRGYVSGAWFHRIPKFERNLATGKPVTCTNPEGGDPSLAVDGNLDIDKHWAGKTPSSLTVDLQKAYRIDRITLVTYYDGSRYYQFTIEVSTDGQKWTTVDDASKNTGAAAATGYESRFRPVETRYVRVNMLKNSANQGTHIVELMVFEAK
jgi:hexosaminidase